MNRITITLAALALVLSGCMPLASHSLSTTGYSTPTYGGTAEAPVTTTAPLPTPADFQLQVIETSRDCFGSAGCVVQYRINPVYVGAGSSPTGSFTMLYEVVGMDDTKTGNITVTSGHFATETGYGQMQQGVTLRARVTQVLEN